MSDDRAVVSEGPAGVREAAVSSWPLDEVRASLGRIVAVTRFALREALHGRSFVAGGLLSLAWLAVPALLGWAFFSNLDAFAQSFGAGPQAIGFAREVATHIVVGTAVGGLSFVAVLVTVFRGSGSISGEIQRGTVLAVAARPIARPELVIGKLLGIVVVAVALFTVLSAATVLVAGLLTGVWVADAPRAILLLDLNLAIVGAVSVAASVRFSPLVATVAVLATYFGITNLDKLFLFGLVTDSEILQQAAVWGRLVLPVGEVSDIAAGILGGPLGGLTEELIRGVSAGFEPRPWIVPYAVAYFGVAVALGCIGLVRRDLR